LPENLSKDHAGAVGALDHFHHTLDTYSHVLPNMHKEAVKAMEGLVNPLDSE
jgi:hypothetical protein